MNTIHKVSKYIDKLHELYPSGMVLGEAKAIVGQYGLTIQWFNRDGTVSQQRYQEGDVLSITEVKGDWLSFFNTVPHSVIHKHHFKGFVLKKVQP